MDINITRNVMHVCILIAFVCLISVKCNALREDKFVSNTTDYCLCKSSCEEYAFSADEYVNYTTILSEELKTNGLLRSGWEKARTYKKSHPSLSENEVLAVVTYTLDYPKVYSYFNFLTRTRGIKDEVYPFKAMHFFLSSAVHKLAISYPQSTFRCETSRQTFAVGNSFSFKQFASTTTDFFSALQFGDFCLHLMTLRGAPISSLSVFPAEKEVLIPSCETFEVVPVEEDTPFYARLRSTGGIGGMGSGPNNGLG
ncbi:ecto-ADP-ribosyltransferase 5-like [Mercenaria mercenaria]|uniref:ecto-ADP-ribosyltransferase 5-like n=1 Tax=Mercenaria mercenaria TaxID=6596 RepID=UPI00234F2DD7|nr:ecto-ADP-ribosyltransferase 5-like [Mercenaria mercenaria]